MSKASDYAAQTKALRIELSAAAEAVVTHEGRLWISNNGFAASFRPEEALKLAAWIKEVFG